MKHSSFDALVSVLDAERSAFGFDAETSALGAATSAIAWSYRGYRRGVLGDIGDCRVGITPLMCNRVTNHGDMSTFSKPEYCFEPSELSIALSTLWLHASVSSGSCSLKIFLFQ